MFLPPRPVRLFAHLLPYPLNLAVPLGVLVVMAWLWWHRTRDDPVRRGKPYGRVVPAEWREPVPPPHLPGTPWMSRPEDRPELGGGRTGSSA